VTILLHQTNERGRSAGSGTTRFWLLRYFTVASLIAFAIVAVLLGYIFRTLSIDGLVNGSEREHVNLAHVIANEIWEQGGQSITMTEGKSAAELQTLPHVPALQKGVRHILTSTSVFKVKIYNTQGVTVFSTDPALIGEDKSTNAGVIAGLQGRNSSQLTHKDQVSTFEGQLQNRDLVESYVPLYDPSSGRISGVFEIYGDATKLLAEIDRRQWYVVTAVIGLLALLYLVLFVIVKRAQDLIIRQNQEREQARQALSLSEERWKFALEGSGAGVWDRNLQTGEVVLSKGYKEIYGFADDELLDHREAWNKRVHPDDIPLVERDRVAYLAGDQPAYANERRMQCKDGSWKWILSRGMVVSRDAQGKPLRMIGTHTDISERHEREEALRLASTVIQTMDEAVTVTDRHNLIVSVNPAFTAITGYPPHEVIGKDPKLLASGMHSPEFYKAMWEKLDSEGSWHGEISNRDKGGRLYVEWLSIKKVCDQKGGLTHYVAVFSDISERKASEQRLHQLAHYDALTGLPNRALFADRLRQAMAKARRDKTRMALLFVDLDKFKPVNDSFGHNVGDLLLKQVAARLSQCLRRESDTVGRTGGDEFVVMLPEVETAQDPRVVGEKILHALNRRFEIEGHSIHISSSIGIAIFPEHGTDENLLMKQADAAMYQAKANGRNRMEVAAT